jgi:hypothetical protein
MTSYRYASVNEYNIFDRETGSGLLRLSCYCTALVRPPICFVI